MRSGAGARDPGMVSPSVNPVGAIIAALHWNEVTSGENNKVLATGFPGAGIQSCVPASGVKIQFMVDEGRRNLVPRSPHVRSNSMRQTIGNFLLRRLKEAGVKHIFGVPGDYNLALMQQTRRPG